MAGQHQAAFDGLGHDFSGAGGTQPFDVGVVDGAHDHRHRGRMGLHQAQDLQRRGRVVVAHHHRGGARQAGGHQAGQARGVAEDHALAGGGSLAHAVGVEVERHVGDALGRQQPGQVLAAAAVAADDDVALGRDGALGDGGQRHRLHQPVVGAQAVDDAVAVQDEEGRGQHRQHHAGQDGAHPFGRHQAAVTAQGQQHEAELARLRQVQAGAQRHTRRGAEGARQHRDECELDQQRQRAQQQHQQPLFGHRVPVELHADGDEEQAQQHIVERPDVGLDLVLVLGLGHQHAGHEGAQRQRQAGAFGKVGQAQRHQQQVQHEQLFAAPPRHQRQPPAHHALATHQQQGQHSGGLQQRHGHLGEQFMGRAAERRYQHQQRHHGQVLEQQHADDALAVFAFQFQPLGHQLDDDGGGAHRDGPAQHHRALPVHAPDAAGEPAVGRGQQGMPEQGAGDGQHDLAEAEAEDQRAHAAQLGQVELEPDHEHQEHDAEFGQVLHPGGVLGQRQRVGADQHAHHQVAQHRRQPQRATDDHAEHRGHQVEQDEFEGGRQGRLGGA